jgi:hypothetical protein
LSLKEYDLWELVNKVVTPPTYPPALEVHNKKDTKVKKLFLDLVKEHIIPHLSEKNMTKEMFDSLVSLFQRKKMARNMVLRNKLV